jgi:hypothetical protein
MKNRTITAQEGQWFIDEASSYWRVKLAAMWAMDIVLNKDIEISENLYNQIRESDEFDSNTLDDIFGIDIKLVLANDLSLGECILSRGDHKDALILRTSNGFVDLYELGWGVTNINPLTSGQKVKVNISYEII